MAAVQEAAAVVVQEASQGEAAQAVSQEEAELMAAAPAGGNIESNPALPVA